MMVENGSHWIYWLAWACMLGVAVAAVLDGRRQRRLNAALLTKSQERTRALEQAFDAQAELESFAQTISDAQPTLLAYIDKDLRLKFANRAILKWVGLTREEAIGRFLKDILSNTERVQWDDSYISRALGGEVVERQMRMVDANGRAGDFLTYRVPDVRDGVSQGYFFVATDVTELRRAEAQMVALNGELMRAWEFSRKIADNIPGRVAYWDSTLHCRFVNRVYSHWHEKRPDELVGRHIDDIFGTERPLDIERRVAGALAGEVQEFERDDVSPSGKRIRALIHYTPDFEGDKVRGFFVLVRDVTARHEAERRLLAVNEDLVRARDEAESADRAKSAFLANISHEIRTPMNAIVGLTHLLRREVAGGVGGDRLKRIGEAANHLLGLINGVLDLTKIESGKFVLEEIDFSLDTVFSRAFAVVIEAARQKGIELVIDTDHVPRSLRGDPTRLSQALVNLLGNAIKFTAKGSVSLVASLIQRGGDDLVVRFEVHDTGPGISQADLGKLFTTFEQGDSSTTRRFGGTGLGLVITRHIARLMGGDAGARSVLGEGSTFWITAALRAGDAAGADTNPTPLAGFRALLVDDLAEAREAMAQMLRRMGMRTDTVPGGEEALASLEHAQAQGDPYDVVLVDWLMPKIDGLELVERMLAQNPRRAPKFMMVSESSDDNLRRRALALGIPMLLAKPVFYSTLRDSLVRLLIGGGDDATAPVGLDLLSEEALRDSFHGLRVLLAEDNEVNQEVARSLMELVGLQVDVAGDGRLAVSMAQANDYAVILMDVQMPDLDGLAATRLLRANPRTAKVPIIAMTANAYVEDRDECLAAGMNDFLTKPVDPKVFYEVLGEWLKVAAPRAAPAVSSGARYDGIPGLDAARGVKFFAGSAASYEKGLRLFEEIYANGLPPIEATSGGTRAGALRRELHSFGGACLSVGAVALADAATALTALAVANPDDESELDRQVRALNDEIALLCAALRRVWAGGAGVSTPP